MMLISTAREEYFDQQIGYSHRLNNHEGLLSLGLWLQCAVQIQASSILFVLCA